MADTHGVLVRVSSGPGVLHELTGVIAKHQGDISSVEILGHGDGEARIYFEIELPADPAPLIDELRALPIVREVGQVATLRSIYGKRVIIMGGGAQVGQVAIRQSNSRYRGRRCLARRGARHHSVVAERQRRRAAAASLFPAE